MYNHKVYLSTNDENIAKMEFFQRETLLRKEKYCRSYLGNDLNVYVIQFTILKKLPT